MKSEKKCPECGQWSEWNGLLTDRCQNCNALLSPVEAKRSEEKEEREKKQSQEWMFYYKPDAPFYEKFYKQAGKFIYGIIMAIVSFIIWLLMWLGP